MLAYTNITKGEYIIMKKRSLLTVVLALVMTIGACFTCFAAEAGVSDKEQAILDALKAGITLDGKTVELPEKYYTQAVNYLASNDLTDEAVDNVVADIADTKKAIVDTGATSVADLKAKLAADTTVASTIAAKINAAGTAAGVTLNVDLSTGTPSYALADSDGKIVANSDAVIKKTGVDYTTTVVAALAVAAVLGGCVVAARKNNLFAQEA